MISKLHSEFRECGTFTVIQHPITGNACTEQEFVAIFLTVLEQFEDQLDTLFMVGPMDKLLFKDESARMFFVETAKSLNITLEPKKPVDGVYWMGTNGFNLMHYHLQIRAERLRQARIKTQKEELERALAKERESKRADTRALRGSRY
ncbi:hypothetical protein Klosneuvirus_3_138 [Klosneuvirus KNV1]|uniref:Uncharacterized protein n=1 Tax=Klosneuvirus KNV1 TaxID=1977640 RepID=A0A1V0SJX0_9VIRU|nr:hypothetical protein Klosneuvirus_3_138 [Klosneuvirus KNV1]